MKIRNSLFESAQYSITLNKIHQSPKLSVMDAYRVNRLIKKINELNSEYNDLKKGLLEKFGSPTENPQDSDIDAPKEVTTEQYSYTVPPENRDDFLKEMQDLINIEHDLETEKLPFPEKIDEGITVADIDVLDIFFDFGFEDSKSTE